MNKSLETNDSPSDGEPHIDIDGKDCPVGNHARAVKEFIEELGLDIDTGLPFPTSFPAIGDGTLKVLPPRIPLEQVPVGSVLPMQSSPDAQPVENSVKNTTLGIGEASTIGAAIATVQVVPAAISQLAVAGASYSMAGISGSTVAAAGGLLAPVAGAGIGYYVGKKIGHPKAGAATGAAAGSLAVVGSGMYLGIQGTGIGTSIPFLMHVLAGTTAVPLIVGMATGAAIGTAVYLGYKAIKKYRRSKK